jgi:hypothetical protein
MKSSKMGRPTLPKKHALGEVFAVRLRSDDAKQVRAAINRSNEKRSDWLRNAVLTAAKTENPSKSSSAAGE